jgi:hypothetical protein
MTETLTERLVDNHWGKVVAGVSSLFVIGIATTATLAGLNIAAAREEREASQTRVEQPYSAVTNAYSQTSSSTNKPAYVELTRLEGAK